jgi:hypothetical protein
MMARTSLTALVLSLAPALAPQEGAPAPGGELRRVAPVEPAPELDDDDPRELFARDFEPERWRARLSVPDLARREKSFDALLSRARLDPIARAFLEELARDPAGGELAWTARLGLRELGRAPFPLLGPAGDPFGFEPRLGQLMQELLTGDALRFQALGRRGTAQPPARAVELQVDPAGVLLRLRDEVDGEPRTREFAGASLVEVLRAHPELADEIEQLGFPASLLRAQAGAPGVLLAPQGLSAPAVTDRLGVIVTPLAPARAQELGLERDGEPYGLRVERAFRETYAHVLGVRTGDVLLELDGHALRTGDEIARIMAARSPDDPLTLTWLDELGQRQVRSWRPERRGGR